MIDTICFFASKKDICNIFYKIEQEFDIKYCMTRADKKVDEKECRGWNLTPLKKLRMTVMQFI